MRKHTPEPWEYSCGAIFQERGSVSIAKTHGAELFQGAMTDRDAISERIKEDARRIVACVNACAGMETEILENMTILGNTLLDRLDLRKRREAELKSQRDEMLEALEAITGGLETSTKPECLSRIHKIAEDAIAKAKGGAA